MTMIIDGSLGTTFPDSSLQPAAASPYVLKNKIINGAMVIDQRNAGASVSIPSTGGQYTLDRWKIISNQSSKMTVQQNAASVTSPTGFTNYLGITSSSSYTVLTGDYFYLEQDIEGFNVSDLGFGTASAKTVTLSFWVRSSLTGTFGGAFSNSAQDRSYPFSYTISSANTWTQISITITGDTSGTWLTTNGVGIRVFFGLGVGTTYSGTAGAWASATYVTATGATSVVGTNGATWYITGVQLEVGTTATPFERRLYNQELANCQRYYWRSNGSTANNVFYGEGLAGGSTSAYIRVKTPMTMRVLPTSLDYSTLRLSIITNSFAMTSASIADGNPDNVVVQCGVASGLTATTQMYMLYTATNSSGYIGFSAEL